MATCESCGLLASQASGAQDIQFDVEPHHETVHMGQVLHCQAHDHNCVISVGCLLWDRIHSRTPMVVAGAMRTGHVDLATRHLRQMSSSCQNASNAGEDRQDGWNSFVIRRGCQDIFLLSLHNSLPLPNADSATVPHIIPAYYQQTDTMALYQ